MRLVYIILSLFLVSCLSCKSNFDTYKRYCGRIYCAYVVDARCVGLRSSVECRVSLSLDRHSNNRIWNETMHQMVLPGDRVCQYRIQTKVEEKIILDYYDLRVDSGDCE